MRQGRRHREYRRDEGGAGRGDSSCMEEIRSGRETMAEWKMKPGPWKQFYSRGKECHGGGSVKKIAGWKSTREIRNASRIRLPVSGV